MAVKRIITLTAFKEFAALSGKSKNPVYCRSVSGGQKPVATGNFELRAISGAEWRKDGARSV